MWLLLAEAGEQGGKSSLSSLTRVLIATAAMALTNLFYKVGLQHGAVPGNHGGGAGLGVLFAGDDFRLGRRTRLSDSARASGPTRRGAALTLFGAFVALMHGLALGPASVLVPVAQMSFVFTALLGAVMFHERLDTKKYAGLAIAVAALALFAIS